MSMEAFESWLASRKDERGWFWFIKRLSANDTLANKSHQAGPYLPKDVAFSLFPSVNRPGDKNPDTNCSVIIDSHSCPAIDTRIVWYNSETRNETRITRWGGSSSPVLDPDSTGSIVVMAFSQEVGRDADGCHVWLCSNSDETVLTSLIGDIEPGIPRFLGLGFVEARSARTLPSETPCRLKPEQMPDGWLLRFPPREEIADQSVKMRPLPGAVADKRLITRLACEYEIFQSVEEHFVLPRILEGFKSIESFLQFSSSVANRRKNRAGYSFELQLARIFGEEGLSFSHGAVSEGAKRPDFLFPSAESYRRGDERVWMLAAKTTCKDRWRQILNEAERIPIKYLATLQDGVSRNQYNEMREAGVRLVVPSALHKRFPKEIRGELINLRSFIRLVSSGV